ncbi:MAG: peptide deformylase [Geminicoccaceae bacterium]|nr:peptide deformylase [Geminicoccaceae bacterium]
MSILKIARMGHPVLRTVAAPVATITDEVRRLIDDMIETMVDAEGIGLAAPQVHRPERVIVFLDVERRDETAAARPIVLINPEITPLGDEMELGLEGCLSMPGLRGLVPRHARIRYRGQDPSGRTVEREAVGLHARVVQHEVDHLGGILYPERMTDLRTLVFESELRHLATAAEKEPSV